MCVCACVRVFVCACIVCACCSYFVQARYTNCSLKTGGLGDLLEIESFESWLCVRDHPCASNYASDSYFCFVYDERRSTFVPWGENAELHLVDV